MNPYQLILYLLLLVLYLLLALAVTFLLKRQFSLVPSAPRETPRADA